MSVCLSVRPGPETHIPKKVPGSKRKKSSLCNFLFLSLAAKEKKNTARSLCNFLLLSLAAKGKKVPCVTSSSCPWQQKEKKFLV